MSYFKLNSVDYSSYVNELKVSKGVNYNSQTNAAGNTVVDYVNSKRVIEVGIIPLDTAIGKEILTAVDAFSVSISFYNPNTDAIEENVSCIIPDTDIEFYTIRADKKTLKAFTLKFKEL